MTDLQLAGPADQTGMRRANLALVLRELRFESQTRARLASITGLTKSTVSSLVDELASRGLVHALEPARAGSIGRPGHVVQLLPRRVIGLGLEINVDYIAAVAVDLVGNEVARERWHLDVKALSVKRAVELTVRLTEKMIKVLANPDTVLAGIGVAVPGLVDPSRGVICRAPNLAWRDFPLRTHMSEKLCIGDVPLYIDNDANFAAIAEHRVGVGAGTDDLLYLTGEVGIGGGVIADGRLFRGAGGYAGEVGHMTIDRDGPPCGCGRRGCWEALCGLTPFLAAVADPGDPVRDPTLDLDTRLDLIMVRAEAGEQRTCQGIRAMAHHLGRGLAILVNILNPRVVILGGYFARLGEFLAGPVSVELRHGVFAGDYAECAIELSQLGFCAAATGGAHIALERTLTDPPSVPLLPDATPSVPFAQTMGLTMEASR